MKKIAILTLACTLAAGSVLATEDKVLATYNGGEVREQEMMTQLESLFAQQPALKNKKFAELDKAMQESILKGHITNKLLEEEIKKAKIEQSDEFKTKISEISKQLLQQILLEREIKKNVSDNAIDSEYKKIVAEMTGKQEVKASHILLGDEKTAKSVKKKLDRGAKFAELAKEYSKDDGSKVNGGELGYFQQGQMVPAFEEKAFGMNIGSISEPVKTDFGWHLIKVDDKRDVKVPTKDEAKQYIVSKINRDTLEKYIENLQNNANIKLNM